MSNIDSLLGSMDTKRQELSEEDDDSSSIDLGKVSNMSKQIYNLIISLLVSF